jgi:UDP:flavonoid glycosyltransferase YjiC (YdhE family)
MPSRDLIHLATKTALSKDGWSITADPLPIRYDDLTVFADLAAERTITARRARRNIVVEAKSFVGSSLIRDLEHAVGQFSIYRVLLEEAGPRRELWLALPQEIFDDFCQRPAIRLILNRCEIALIVIDLKRQEVVQWIRRPGIVASSAD